VALGILLGTSVIILGNILGYPLGKLLGELLELMDGIDIKEGIALLVGLSVGGLDLIDVIYTDGVMVGKIVVTTEGSIFDVSIEGNTLGNTFTFDGVSLVVLAMLGEFDGSTEGLDGEIVEGESIGTSLGASLDESLG
jgi:hypothetical protein